MFEEFDCIVHDLFNDCSCFHLYYKNLCIQLNRKDIFEYYWDVFENGICICPHCYSETLDINGVYNLISGYIPIKQQISLF